MLNQVKIIRSPELCPTVILARFSVSKFSERMDDILNRSLGGVVAFKKEFSCLGCVLLPTGHPLL